MIVKTFFSFVAAMILCAGCGKTPEVTATPDFFTAILPPAPTPRPTQTPIPPAPATTVVQESNVSSIEGTTTTQLNVRVEPSTASASLGMIGIFSKIQIAGRDASGSWYQILYAESQTGKGWVRAEYVQVNAPAEIPLVGTESGPGAAVSGLAVQKVNVRSGPGTTYESLGVLNPNDVVLITGRDSSGGWIQVEFAGASDGKGWVTAEFLQAENLENVPLIGMTVEATSTRTVGTPAMSSASLDGDSMQNPLTTASFSPTGSRALQVKGDVSAPGGDAEDWIQFTSQAGNVSVQATCQGAALRMELWKNGKPVDDFSCGEASLTNVEPGVDYFLRLVQNETGYTSYVLNLEVIP